MGQQENQCGTLLWSVGIVLGCMQHPLLAGFQLHSFPDVVSGQIGMQGLPSPCC